MLVGVGIGSASSPPLLFSSIFGIFLIFSIFQLFTGARSGDWQSPRMLSAVNSQHHGSSHAWSGGEGAVKRVAGGMAAVPVAAAAW